MPHFETYKDASGYFRWRLRAGNGQIIATAGEGYVRLQDCEHGIQLVRQYAPTAPLQALTR